MRPESATETLPVPVGAKLKERYRHIQNEFDKRELESLHVWTRERIDALLDEAEQFLSGAS